MDIFHNGEYQCCNEYICARREQGIDLPLQAVGDTVTMVSPGLIHDLESEAKTRSLKDYKDLADEVASLMAALKMCHDMLTSEHGRIV
jgi:hypothetical protein